MLRHDDVAQVVGRMCVHQVPVLWCEVGTLGLRQVAHVPAHHVDEEVLSGEVHKTDRGQEEEYTWLKNNPSVKHV